MYTLLHGALKNVGDFLIYERAKQLLRQTEPDRQFLERSRYEPLDSCLDEVNSTSAVVLCGGPGYREDFYPTTFALTNDLTRIEVPIIPFGLGWSGYPAGRPGDFRFTPTSLDAVRVIHDRCLQSGCRDVLTRSILRRHGIRNVVMTGCPAWYDSASLGTPFQPPEEVTQVVVTTPRRLRLIPQAIELMRRVRTDLPSAVRYCVFHRGYSRDTYTTVRRAWAMQVLRLAARVLGYRVVNAAYDLSRIEFYRECDLHVGYRVHASICFLSMRKPTILLCEDGRGEGLSQSLGLQAPTAYNNPQAVALAMQRLHHDLETNFERFAAITDRIDRTYESAMVPFLVSMP